MGEYSRVSRPVTDAVNCPSCPLTRLHRHGVGLSTPEKIAGSLLETQVVNPWFLTREELCCANGSSVTAPAPGVALPPGRHPHREGPWQSERFRAGVDLPVVEERLFQETMGGVWGLGGPQSGEPLMVHSKRPPPGRWSLWSGRARPRRRGKPSGELAPSLSDAPGFSTPPAGSTGLSTSRAPTLPPSLGPGSATSHPSGHAGARTGPSGHRPPRPGSGPHAPGPPRSPPGDDPTAEVSIQRFY